LLLFRSSSARPTGLAEAWATLAQQGDIEALRDAAGRAVEQGDAMKAWTWQYLALLHGADLTVSTMRDCHDGGLKDGEFHDSDFGGAMDAAGDEGVRLPPAGAGENQRARALAREIHEWVRWLLMPLGGRDAVV
jgi:hypothetical protein